MSPPENPKRPPPLPDGLPRISPGGDQPERGAVRMPRAEPPKRTATLPGIPSVAVPRQSGEFAPTLPAPNPLEKRTWRLPTPPSALAHARRTDPPAGVEPPPTSIRVPADNEPSSGQPGASAELLAARAKLAEYERRERVQVESRGPGPYQPPLRSQSPVPSSAPSKADAALGMTVRHLLAKAAPFLLAAAGIGGGVTAIAKPSADPAKTDATLANIEELGRKIDRVDTKVNGLLDREPQLTEFVECLYEQQADYFEQLLPSQQRLVTGSLQRTWVDRCRNRRPKR